MAQLLVSEKKKKAFNSEFFRLQGKSHFGIMSETQMWASWPAPDRRCIACKGVMNFLFCYGISLGSPWCGLRNTHINPSSPSVLMLRAWGPYLRASSFRASKRTWCCSLDSPNDLCARKWPLILPKATRSNQAFVRMTKKLRVLSLAASSAGQGQGPELFGNMTIESLTYRT